MPRKRSRVRISSPADFPRRNLTRDDPMKISVISIGEVKNKNTIPIEKEYIKRLTPYFRISIQEISVKKLSTLPEKQRKEKECDIIRQKIKAGDFLILLDEGGKTYDSLKFASMLKKHMLESTKQIVFAVGGVYGWDEDFKKEANAVLSLSSLTFTYELARLILIEQIYRATTIINRIPYHKE